MTVLDAGDFKLRQGVLELIAGIALNAVGGASGVAVRPEHPEERRKRKHLVKGIKAEVEGGTVSIDLEAHMEYGKDFRAVAEEVQREVARAVSRMTGWEVKEVNVTVVGVNAL